ncbi:MAG: rubrerythrin family protein [Alistipes sp.]|nr:rubrerythrin family protein [Alistipes sp.]
MRVRPILILILLTTSVAIIGWMYYAVLRTIDKEPKHSHHKVITDLDACCRDKHIKSAQYAHFASVAEQENLPSALGLFRALAHSERIQEHYCALVIHRLGGHYTPPKRILLFRGNTASNLLRSIALEQMRPDTLLHQHIGRHLYGGNRMAAQALIWAAAADRQHLLLLQQAHAALCTDHTMRYTVCPRCGNIYQLDSQDPFCPHCLTDSREFVLF